MGDDELRDRIGDMGDGAQKPFTVLMLEGNMQRESFAPNGVNDLVSRRPIELAASDGDSGGGAGAHSPASATRAAELG
jgi:hypothetical protein